MSFDFPVANPPTIPGDVEFDSARINNLAPVETIGAYTPWKIPVKAATTANITLEGTQTIDTVILVVGDRVLVKDQTTASEDGIYIVSSTQWPRSEDLELGVSAAGTGVYVTDGDVNLNNLFICTNVSGSDIVGTDDLVFAAAAYEGNIGLNSGNIFVGNGSNIATGVSPSGDVASVSTAGAFTFANTGVTAGNYTSANITVDSKGRITLAANGAGGSPGGANTQVQYNDAGSFGGSSLFTFDSTQVSPINGTLAIGLEQAAVSGTELGKITGIDATTADVGGSNLLVSGGKGNGLGNGGNSTLRGGEGGPTGIPGLGVVSGGEPDSGAVNSNGGGAVVIGVDSVGTGNAGPINISGGSAPDSGLGGHIILDAGNSENGSPGFLNISAGDVINIANANNGGIINITSGDTNGTGNSGNINITTPDVATGDGGTVTVTAGTGGTNDGQIDIVTSGETNTFRTGGLVMSKGTNAGVTVGGSIAINATAGPAWQGNVTVTDSNTIGAGGNGLITITMPTTFTLSNQIQLTIQTYSFGAGIPLINVETITAGTSFTIRIREIGGGSALAAGLVIGILVI